MRTRQLWWTMCVAAVMSSASMTIAMPVGAATPDAFTALGVPARLLDTRPGAGTADRMFSGGGVRPSGTVLALRVAGRAGVPVDAVTVVVNVTADAARETGFVTLFPCGQPIPNASNLNYGVGATVANAAVVAIGDGGDVCVYNFGATDVIVDVTGYLSDTAFSPLPAPQRLADSRPGAGTADGLFSGGGPRPAGSTLELTVAGRVGVPAGATAVALNVTADAAREYGYVTVFPCGQAVPNSSNVNYTTGTTAATAVVSALGADGKVCFYLFGAAQLIVDVAGTFAPGVFSPLAAPRRLADTRTGAATFDGLFAGSGERAGGSNLELRVAGRAGVPATASGVVLNVTVDAASTAGFVTVHPAPTQRPNASNLNYQAGQTVANMVVAPVGAGGDICLFTYGATHLIVDVAGWLDGPPPPAAEAACPVPPVTLLDPPDRLPFPFHLPCNAGPALQDITRVQINPGLKPYLDNIDQYLSGPDLYRLAYTVMANSGPLPAAVASYKEFTHWIENVATYTGITDLSGFMSALNIAYHETLHVVTRNDCVQTGPTTGVRFSPGIGFAQSETYDDVVARIDTIAAASGDYATINYHAGSAKSVASTYLQPGTSTASQGFGSQIWEMVAYGLSAEWGTEMDDMFGVAYLGTSASNDTTMYLKWHQMYRYLHLASSRPDVWAQLTASGLPSAVAGYWNMAAGDWRLYSSSIFVPQFSWDLMFGPDVGSMGTYTGGSAGGTAPPRPPLPGPL